MDIVDIQCSRGGSHTSWEILAQERGLQGGKGGKLLLKTGYLERREQKYDDNYSKYVDKMQYRTFL